MLVISHLVARGLLTCGVGGCVLRSRRRLVIVKRRGGVILSAAKDLWVAGESRPYGGFCPRMESECLCRLSAGRGGN